MPAKRESMLFVCGHDASMHFLLKLLFVLYTDGMKG